MKTTNVALYAFRLTFSQAPPLSAQASTHSSHAFSGRSSSSPNRVVTRSATMLAVFGIALSSFSLKQLLANKNTKHNALRKL
ncbi:uncharacterized protein LOC6561132 [Drosophila grimshawi]|uniref:GH20268 n=1 Tax=Drosophila grimshawi TaxID=7222 RepID=B4J5D7_DROGR|nr:uncharacterized protein LOC6561132 [Drosophila grimshawi]EDW01779.1 GH20268 [Drosophila grimshawi]